MTTHIPLSEAELERLDTFLMSPRTPDATMDVETLDGFLVAITIGPEEISEDEWLPGVFDGQPPEFSDQQEADDILGLIRRHAATVAAAFSVKSRNNTGEEPVYYPLILEDEGVDEKWKETVGQYWASGFAVGISVREEPWHAFFDDSEEFAQSIDSILELVPDIDPDVEPMTIGQREKRLAELPWRVEDVMYSWLDRRFSPVAQVINETPKVGRNDPCPCGSGKKFKKCHGA